MRGHTETRWTDRAKAWAVVVALLCVPFAVAAFDSSALPGPSGGAAFTATGGTVTQPVVFTGDNSGGTGTLRIRPSDEDAQLVLCEASNNSATEMCTSVHHANISATQSLASLSTNLYFDSSTVAQRYWTSAGFGRVWTGAGSAATSNEAGLQVYGTSGAEAGRVSLQASSTNASNFFVGVAGTVTTDIRGPILNGGSATCATTDSGDLCLNDLTAINSGHAVFTYGLSMINTSANASEGVSITATGGGGTVLACYGASTGDPDYDSRCGLFAPASTGLYVWGTTNVGAGTPMLAVVDNSSGTGATLATVDGEGNVFLNASATRTKGTKVLVAGTGTVTVASGSICTCTDTTAIAAVQCSVATTTLTINGTGTDTIAYHCL